MLPAEAIADFVMTDMDSLVLGDRLLTKETMWPTKTPK